MLCMDDCARCRYLRRHRRRRDRVKSCNNERLGQLERMEDGSSEEVIVSLRSARKWEEIVNLTCSLDQAEKNRLFWVLPRMSDLCWMKKLIEEFGLCGLVSIGCGCGLLEWLFQMYSGLDVIGVELDQSWWRSKYSPPLFLENITFIQESSTRSFCVTEQYALLFCYFNNADAFSNYIQNYKGNLVLVIGPNEDELLRTTDPLPFDKKFQEHGWQLIGKKEIGRSNDLIVAYSK